MVYHGNCPDGWCAAFLALKRWPDLDVIPATHGQPAPVEALRGKHVLFLDFSYKRLILEELLGEVASLCIIDHHKTAEQEVRGVPPSPEFLSIFDTRRAACTLTWDTLYGGQRRPWYVQYVEDRDLGRHVLPQSRGVAAYLMALPHTYEGWVRLDALSLDHVKQLGNAIRLHIDRYVEQMVEERQLGTLQGYTVAIVNAPYPSISDVCVALCDHADIGLGWYERADNMLQFSLRSRNGVDVSEIAQHFNGGGHTNAAGFQLPREQGYATLDYIIQRA